MHALPELFDCVSPDDHYERLDSVCRARGLTSQERHTVVERLNGRSYVEIASDPLMLRAGRPVSKQRVFQIGAGAELKLGIPGALARVLADDFVDRLTRRVSQGRLVQRGELDDPDSLRRRAQKSLSQLETASRRLDELATELLRDADVGTLSPERRQSYVRRAARIDREAKG